MLNNPSLKKVVPMSATVVQLIVFVVILIFVATMVIGTGNYKWAYGLLAIVPLLAVALVQKVSKDEEKKDKSE
jgi:peptidoglycan/LPS O-acetylase OafA/YrhL